GSVPIRQVDEHETAAADIARLGQRHRQGETGGHGGIHRIATLGEDIGPHPAGDGLLGHHHAALPPGGVETVLVLDEGHFLRQRRCRRQQAYRQYPHNAPNPGKGTLAPPRLPRQLNTPVKLFQTGAPWYNGWTIMRSAAPAASPVTAREDQQP